MILLILLPTFLEQFALCVMRGCCQLSSVLVPLQNWSQVLSFACCIFISISGPGLSAEFPPCCWGHLAALFLSSLWCLWQCNSFIKSKVLLHVLSVCFSTHSLRKFVALPSVSGLYLVLGSSNQRIINLYKIIHCIGSLEKPLSND